MLITKKEFKVENITISIVASVILSFILSLKINIKYKQKREEEQIKRLFFKKVINNRTEFFIMKYLAEKPFIVIFLLTLIFIFIFGFLFGIEDAMIRTVLSSVLAVILSPRKKKITTQTGEKTQITWVFLKKPIFID